jgi:acylphosphatase
MASWLNLLEPNCKKIIVTGATSFSVQGVNLRERMEAFARTALDGKPLDIKGKARNLKDGRVEAICAGKDTEKLLQAINKWKEKGIADFTTCEMIDFFDNDLDTYHGFTVERSDDLTEMVLALRGAGYRFTESTKELQRLTEELRNVHKDLLKRDKEYARGRLTTLRYELTRNSEVLASPEANRNKISLDALKSNMESPAIPDPQFVHALSEVYFKLQDYQRQGEDVEVNQLIEQFKTLNKLIEPHLSPE